MGRHCTIIPMCAYIQLFRLWPGLVLGLTEHCWILLQQNLTCNSVSLSCCHATVAFQTGSSSMSPKFAKEMGTGPPRPWQSLLGIGVCWTAKNGSQVMIGERADGTRQDACQLVLVWCRTIPQVAHVLSYQLCLVARRGVQ